MTEYSSEALPAARKKIQVKPIVRWAQATRSKYMTLWCTAIMPVISRRPISRPIMNMCH